MTGRRHIPLALALVALGGVAVVLAVVLIGGGGGSTDQASERESEAGLAGEFAEAAEQARGREEALDEARRKGTLGLIDPLAVDAAPGWRGERLWRKKADDWEPAVAGRPGSSRVYMLTTRYGGKPACPHACPDPAIRLRASRDGGLHWGHDRYLCRCRGSKNQYDPQIEMAANGSLYAAWLDGFTPGVTFARSDDGGRSWTKPIHVDKRLAWSDKPIVAVSDDGKDVYVAFNGPTDGDAWVAVSHDRGNHFGQPVPAQRNRRYHFAGGRRGLSRRNGRVRADLLQPALDRERARAGDDLERRRPSLAERRGGSRGEAAELRLEGLPEGLLRPPGRDGRGLRR